MRTPSIINRYIFRELIPPFSISLLFLTFIFLMVKIPEIINMVVNYDAGIAAVLLLITFLVPRILEFALPLSVMVSVLITFMRMSGDNEIIALKSGGVTIYRLLPPVILFTFLCMLMTTVVTVYGVPWGKLSMKKKGIEIASSTVNVALKERSFNSHFDNVMIYISSTDIVSGELRDVFIEDSRTENQVIVSVAPRGILISDPEAGIYTLRLFRGKVNQVNLEDKLVNTVGFDRYDINLDFGSAMGDKKKDFEKDLDEMSLKELFDVAGTSGISDRKRNSAFMQVNEKFSLPLACMVLGVLAMAIGLQSGSTRKSSGFGLGLFFILLYYLLLAGGWSVGETGVVSPGIGMWFPDVVMGLSGGYLLVRIAKERPLTFPEKVEAWLIAVKNRLIVKTG